MNSSAILNHLRSKNIDKNAIIFFWLCSSSYSKKPLSFYLVCCAQTLLRTCSTPNRRSERFEVWNPKVGRRPPTTETRENEKKKIDASTKKKTIEAIQKRDSKRKLRFGIVGKICFLQKLLHISEGKHKSAWFFRFWPHRNIYTLN